MLERVNHHNVSLKKNTKFGHIHFDGDSLFAFIFHCFYILSAERPLDVHVPECEVICNLYHRSKSNKKWN